MPEDTTMPHAIDPALVVPARIVPSRIVQTQLDAYNAHDLDRFVACFSDDVCVYRMPVQAPNIVGKAALRAFYAEHRFSIASLRAELLNRMTLGDKVADHERIHGLGQQPTEVMAVYQVSDGAITHVWFFYP